MAFWDPMGETSENWRDGECTISFNDKGLEQDELEGDDWGVVRDQLAERRSILDEQVSKLCSGLHQFKIHSVLQNIDPRSELAESK
jgi:hypothetical protein